ncbi:MAG: amidohydrolase [Clostridia bacterium]|nr:amidohydrolase [Clostridia bacterium]
MYKGHKVIDAHCHIYPEKIAAKAVEGIGGFYDLKMNEKGMASDMLARGESVGIDKHLIFSVATKPAQVKSINEFIAREAQASGGKMIGLGTIHPDSEDMKGDIEHILELGLKGIKIHPDFQAFKLDDYRYLKAYELCAGRLPVLIHTGDFRYDYSNPNRMKPLLEIFTDVTFIGAHFGGWSVWEQATQELSGYDNFYVDCSSSFYALTPEVSTKLIRTYGADKVLFGSDYPMWKAENELDYLFSLPLSEAERDLILHKNTEEIFKL